MVDWHRDDPHRAGVEGVLRSVARDVYRLLEHGASATRRTIGASQARAARLADVDSDDRHPAAPSSPDGSAEPVHGSTLGFRWGGEGVSTFVPGAELSRRFYDEVVQPILSARFPDLRHAAALLGRGSEVLGFDDEMSSDHDWKPRVLVFLAEQDEPRHSAAVREGAAAGAAAGLRRSPDPLRGPHRPRLHPATAGAGPRPRHRAARL